MDFKIAGNAISRLVYSIAGEKYKDFVTIGLNWERMVGKYLARYSKVKKFEDGVLFIAVSNNVWMQELFLRKNDVIKKIQKNLDININDIIYYLKT